MVEGKSAALVIAVIGIAAGLMSVALVAMNQPQPDRAADALLTVLRNQPGLTVNITEYTAQATYHDGLYEVHMTIMDDPSRNVTGYMDKNYGLINFTEVRI
jgi:hypothetical protein